MSNVSLWSEFTPRAFHSVSESAHFDVVIVGGGITGLTTALMLKESGKRVCVLEKETIGSGETAHSSAHLTYMTDLRYTTLAKRFGEREAALVWHAGASAIDLIESRARRRDDRCGFARVPGYLYSALDSASDEAGDLRAEQEQIAGAGFRTRFLEQGPVQSRPAIEFANQALLHPLKYIAALAEWVEGDGSRIFEHAEASDFRENPLSLSANGHRITGDALVIATHVPLTGVRNAVGAALFQLKLAPYSSYVMHGVMRSCPLPAGLYSDTADPYNYLRIHETDGVLHAILGGEDHKTGVASDTKHCLEAVETTFRKLLPDVEIRHQWSGQVIETNDGLPYIGESAPGQYIATGFAGNGLTFGTIAGMMLCDAINGIPHPLKELLNPARRDLIPGLATIVSENAAYPWRMIADRLHAAEPDIRTMQAGEGRVVKVDGHHVAISKQEDGKLLAVSAACTHLGCIVAWNNAEQTWDCPCHGSRFTNGGTVLGGPAETPLAAVPLAEVRAAGE